MSSSPPGGTESWAPSSATTSSPSRCPELGAPVPVLSGPGEPLERGGQAAGRLRQLLEDREVIVNGHRQVLAGKPLCVPGRPVVLGLADQLRQLAEPDGDDER